jgi:parvulin-like peptidyl-prolyl isomerase
MRGGISGSLSGISLIPKPGGPWKKIPEGGVTELMVRPKGIQIIKILKKQGGEKKPLEDVRDAIYETLYRQEVDRRYNEWIEALRKSSYTKIIF